MIPPIGTNLGDVYTVSDGEATIFKQEINPKEMNTKNIYCNVGYVRVYGYVDGKETALVRAPVHSQGRMRYIEGKYPMCKIVLELQSIKWADLKAFKAMPLLLPSFPEDHTHLFNANFVN